MFDAKSLLEALVTGGGGAQRGGGQSGAGGLGDLLGQIMQQGGGGQSSGGQSAGGLGDLLGGVLSGGKPAAPGAAASDGGASGGGLPGGLGDLLGKVQQKGSEGAGNIADVLGQVLGQASQGVKEGAGKVNDATGAGDALEKLVKEMSGKSPDEIMAQIQDLIANNKLGAGAALGGLGALILGTQTGRSAAVTAAKIGALAMISGLAYKAYQNYQAGKPLIDTGAGEPQAAPSGSGFEPDAVDNDNAALMIRTMLAAAAADGRIDGAEQERVLGSLKEAGVDAEAEEFIARALNNPLSIQDIAGAVRTREEAVQVYTAARLAIDLDTRGEAAFLAQLASALGIEPALAEHIDAATRGAAA